MCVCVEREKEVIACSMKVLGNNTLIVLCEDSYHFKHKCNLSFVECNGVFVHGCFSKFEISVVLYLFKLSHNKNDLVIDLLKYYR